MATDDALQRIADQLALIWKALEVQNEHLAKLAKRSRRAED